MTSTSTDSLNQAVVLITGGASGLGAACAHMMAKRGARIALADINHEAAVDLAHSLGGIAIKCDVTNAEQVDNAVQETVGRFGSLDVMVNNAGIAPIPDPKRFDQAIVNQMSRLDPSIVPQPLEVLTTLSDTDWDVMIRIHLYGVFHGTRAALRIMTPQRSGSIINMSSVLGLRPSPMAPHYSAAKAAIIGLTKSVSAEVAPFGIRVNAVCPGYTDTPLLEPMTPTMRAAIVSQVGMARLGNPDEIAEVVSFLASPASSYCTGEVFSASGGYLS
jgi:NAD(P)-dependent dehydrogenase (short-subunit alcohol dehydrogenase family)